MGVDLPEFCRFSPEFRRVLAGVSPGFPEDPGVSKAPLIAIALTVAVFLVTLFIHRTFFAYKHPPGIVVKEPPLQKDLKEEKKWNHNGYLITALAEFEMTGRVLIAERYWSGREADLSPVDLTMAWCEASDTSLLEKIDFYKLERYYRYEWNDPSVDKNVLRENTANMHMIPATDSVSTLLKSVKREDLVHLRGYLIEARATDGWQWRSSLTRSDQGNGACEVIWVENIRTL